MIKRLFLLPALLLTACAPQAANVPANYYSGNLGAIAIRVAPERQLSDGRVVFATLSPLANKGNLFLPVGAHVCARPMTQCGRFFQTKLVQTKRGDIWTPCYGIIDRDKAYVSTLVLAKGGKYPLREGVVKRRDDGFSK